jgi:hypothetical protein
MIYFCGIGTSIRTNWEKERIPLQGGRAAGGEIPLRGVVVVFWRLVAGSW